MDTVQVVERIQELQHLPGALLPILHALQEEFGYIDDAMIPLIAEALNISHAEVHGVISFYHDFRRAPTGKHVLQICRAESCQSMGCNSLIAHVEKNLGVKMGETSADGNFTLRPVYCLGNCALSPAVMLDGQPYGRVSAAVADSLIENARRHA
jgi:formate dehydrogenase subunit gamma